jgi:hypothetical protein
MKSQFCFVIAITVASVSAHAQYRIVQGKIVPRNSTEWTVISDKIEVKGFVGRALLCTTYTEKELNSTMAVPSAHRVHDVGTTTTIKVYKDSFVLTNYPSGGRFHIGDLVPGPIAVMRLDGSGSVALYDYGVDYTPPARKLTPEEAAAAKAQATKMNAGAEAAKLKFDEEQAENGRDLYQYRMGVRYLKGDGVSIDIAKARDYFSKAAAQDNQDAKRALAKLSAAQDSPPKASEH